MAKTKEELEAEAAAEKLKDEKKDAIRELQNQILALEKRVKDGEAKGDSRYNEIKAPLEAELKKLSEELDALRGARTNKTEDKEEPGFFASWGC